MWDRDQRLASFRIADLYEEADRIRFERLAAETSSTRDAAPDTPPRTWSNA